MSTAEKNPKPYARETTVTPEKTRAEIEALLKRHGATQFGTGWSGERHLITFRLRDRAIRLTLIVPTAETYTEDAAGRWIPHNRRATAAAAEERRRWRVMLLMLKAKLEAVASGVVTLEDEFLGYTILKDGRTFAEWYGAQVARLAETGQTPPVLPGLEHRRGLPERQEET